MRCLISHKTEQLLHQLKQPLPASLLPLPSLSLSLPQVCNMSKASLGFSSARAKMKLDVCQAAFPFAIAEQPSLAPRPSPLLAYPLRLGGT